MKVEPTHQIDTNRTIWIYSNIKFCKEYLIGLSIYKIKWRRLNEDDKCFSTKG
jgi:hypothetical protein